MSYIQLANDNFFREEFYSFLDKTPLEYFGKIGKINLLVGANNSRKSRFIRGLIKKNDLKIFAVNPTEIIKELNSLAQKFRDLHEGLDLIKLRVLNQHIGDHLRRLDAYELIVKLTAEFPGETIIMSSPWYSSTITSASQLIREEKKADIQNLINSLNKRFTLLEFLRKHNNPQATVERHNIGAFVDYLSLPADIGMLSEIHVILEKTVALLIDVVKVDPQQLNPKRVYIPTLRNAISLYMDNGKLGQDIYAHSIKTHYKIASTDDKSIWVFTGRDLYNQIKSDRNDEKKIRNRFRDFETFISKSFFPGKEVDIVAKENNKEQERHIQVHFGDNVENRDTFLHDLGDGIQSLFILLYPIFMAENNSWVFIEEPELNMHPGFQTLFFKTITTHEELVKKNLIYFITTHSNHFLNQSLTNGSDVAIFSFENKDSASKKHSEIRQVIGNDVSILNVLGVYNSSVFMANCSIWIEGISDRRYIKAFLLAYMKQSKKEFKEDLNFSFFEYAGSNISHYLFSEDDESFQKGIGKIQPFFLSNRIFLLADRDDSELKQKRHKQISQRIKGEFFDYSTTEAVEIENILSVDIIRKVLADVLKINPSAIDSIEWNEDDYFDTRLGGFLYSKLNHKVPKLPKISGASKPTLSSLTTDYKNKFSQYVYEEVEKGNLTWEMISKNKHAKKIIEKIYGFILKHNK